MGANNQTTKELIEAIANVVIAHADELTDLDRAIGDAEHGVNLTRGFRAVLARMDTIGVMPLGKALSEVGTTLIRSVGGASGPLYGKLFVTLGKHMDEAGVVSQDTLVHAGADPAAGEHRGAGNGADGRAQRPGCVPRRTQPGAHGPRCAIL